MAIEPEIKRELRQGDVVSLRSGGPRMTVRRVLDAVAWPCAECDWFDGHAVAKDTFPVASLKLEDV